LISGIKLSKHLDFTLRQLPRLGSHPFRFVVSYADYEGMLLIGRHY
jgi:hypothetical protein